MKTTNTTRKPRNNGEYISKAFQDRIEVSLANISRSKDDEYSLIHVFYSYNYFSCELCNHNPCSYAYVIQNNKTNKKMKVGSECIHHFDGKGINIDLAEGLRKRVKGITRKERRFLKKNMIEAEYKSMTKEEKRQMTISLFLKRQTKELLEGKFQGKTILSKDDVKKILDY
jgi:hypothetical protein